MSEKSRLRDRKIQFWVTEKEYEKIRDKAEYCNLSLSSYLRRVGVDGYIIKREFHAISEVNAIGVNINQIARQVNFQNEVTERELDELRCQYEKLFGVIYDEILKG